MTVPAPPPPHDKPVDPVPPKPAVRDFAQLARRISSRTTDLFAVALIAVVMLTVGVQATRWWRTEPPLHAGGAAATATLGIWDNAANVSVLLNAGDWRLERVRAIGTAKDVTERALETVRSELRLDRPADVGQPDAHEARWLAALAQWSPVEETGSGGKIYELGGPWPWIAATRPASSASAEPPVAPSAGDATRVVCWVFALPQSDQTWTLYIARRERNPGDAADGFHVPIPKDAQHVLSARNAAGGATVFSGSGSPARARNLWERQLTDAGWTPRRPWSHSRLQMHGVFERQHAGETVLLDALLTVDADNRLRGLAEWYTEPTSSH